MYNLGSGTTSDRSFTSRAKWRIVALLVRGEAYLQFPPCHRPPFSAKWHKCALFFCKLAQMCTFSENWYKCALFSLRTGTNVHFFCKQAQMCTFFSANWHIYECALFLQKHLTVHFLHMHMCSNMCTSTNKCCNFILEISFLLGTGILGIFFSSIFQSKI